MWVYGDGLFINADKLTTSDLERMREIVIAPRIVGG